MSPVGVRGGVDEGGGLVLTLFGENSSFFSKWYWACTLCHRVHIFRYIL
jgi:hypothetical protein